MSSDEEDKEEAAGGEPTHHVSLTASSEVSGAESAAAAPRAESAATVSGAESAATVSGAAATVSGTESEPEAKAVIEAKAESEPEPSDSVKTVGRKNLTVATLVWSLLGLADEACNSGSVKESVRQDILQTAALAQEHDQLWSRSPTEAETVETPKSVGVCIT